MSSSTTLNASPVRPPTRGHWGTRRTQECEACRNPCYRSYGQDDSLLGLQARLIHSAFDIAPRMAVVILGENDLAGLWKLLSGSGRFASLRRDTSYTPR